MPTLKITSDELIVNLSFIERLASISRTIRMPLRHVRGATDDDGFRSEMGIRYLGCAIPGLIYAGTFRRKGDDQFVFARPNQHLVVIELEGERWARLILGVTDARAVANDINMALVGSRKKT